MMRLALIRIDPIIGKQGHRAGGALDSLASYLKGKNPYIQDIDIKFFNFNSLYTGSANINILTIASYEPDVVGFSTYCWNMEQVKNYTRELKKLLPRAVLIAGGPEVSYEPVTVMNELKELDIIIRGEGEISFNEVITCIYRNSGDYSHILGVTYRDLAGEIHSNPDRPLHPLLDDFPSPFLTGVIDLSKCNGEVAYETVRGCKFNCSYCLYTKGMNTVRYYSLERVAKELELILSSSHIKMLWFVDPTFNENEERALRILKIIEKYNPQMPLAFELRADYLTDGLIQQLSQLNVAEVAIGLQSYSDEVNLNVRRNNNIARAEENLLKLKKAISGTCEQFDIDLIYGLPGDSYQNYQRSVDYVISLGGRIFYQPLRIFKGTELYSEVDKYQIIYNHTSPYNILSNKTYSVREMIASSCLNVGIDFLNRGGIYRKIIRDIVTGEKLKYSSLLERVGFFFWNLQEYHLFRVSNWTPDDREDELVFDCFVKFIDAYLQQQNTPQLAVQINEEISRYRNELRGNEPRSDEITATYFNLAI